MKTRNHICMYSNWYYLLFHIISTDLNIIIFYFRIIVITLMNLKIYKEKLLYFNFAHGTDHCVSDVWFLACCLQSHHYLSHEHDQKLLI
jgi:hypothetical protein